MRRQLFQRGEDSVFLDEVSPMDRQGGPATSVRDGIVGVGSTRARRPHAGRLKAKDAGLGVGRQAGPRRAGRPPSSSIAPSADDHAVVVGRRLDRDLALLHVEQHRPGIAPSQGGPQPPAAGCGHQDDVAGIERHHVGVAEIDRVVALPGLRQKQEVAPGPAAVAAPGRKKRVRSRFARPSPRCWARRP